MIALDLDAARGWAGIGVAGNFAGHLEQAGEAGDFAGVDAPPEAPKGIFPWYVPGDPGFLGTFPLATDRVLVPPGEDVQIEPEVGVACRLRGGRLEPFAAGAFNDASIRRPDAPRISHKKNWGEASKGVAPALFALDGALPGGPLRLACFLRRDGELHEYGVDSPLEGYSYYGTTLLDWIADRLAHQAAAGPLEDVGALVRTETVLVGIGATRYTELGETTFLQPGDEAIVAVYDSGVTQTGALAGLLAAGDPVPSASVLRQPVVAA